jgi:hypothetical protein
MTTTHSATARIQAKQQTLEDAYSPPANFLEIDIADPQTHGVGKKLTKQKTENTSYYSDQIETNNKIPQNIQLPSDNLPSF